MSLESASVVPTALIRQLQISLRESFSLPSTDLSSDPSSSPAPPPLPSIQDAIASLDPTLDPSARCGRCRGGLLCGGGVPSLCVYCGEGFKGGEGAPPEISFLTSNAYKLLLESLGLDGSEAVNLDPESAEPNKERGPPKAGMILSDLLDLKLAFSPIRINATGTETKTTTEPGSTTYDINLSGINLDAVFKETKKETPQIKDIKSTQNQVPFGNQTSSTSSFAKWDADFGSQPVNPSVPVQLSVPASENLSKANLKREVSEIETQADEEPDEWQDFTGSRAAHNMSDSVQILGPSVENREPLKAEGEKLFGSKDVASSGVAQSGLSDPVEEPKTSPEDTLRMETREALNADGEDAFDDWNAFTGSSSGQEGLSVAVVEPELGLPEPVSVKNVEPLNPGNDLFGDCKNFTEPGGAQSPLPVTGPISGDLFPVNIEKETVIVETAHAIDDSFDDWKDFTGSGSSQSRFSDLDAKSKTSFWDPLTPNKIVEPGNRETLNVGGGELLDVPRFTGSGVSQIGMLGPEEETQPSSQDPLNEKEIEPSDRAETFHVDLNDSFDDWKDFTNSSVVQPRLWNDDKKAEPISRDPLPISTTEQPSNNIGTSNAVDYDSFDDWKDFTSSSAVQTRLQNDGGKAEPISGDPLPISTTEQPPNSIETSNPVDDDSFDDWKDFTSSSAVDGLPDSREKNEPAVGIPSENFDAWPMVGAELKKDSGSTDLWSDGVNGGLPNSVSYNENTDLSDGWLDFMSPSQVGTGLIEGVKINDGDKGSADEWLDFAGLTGPTKTKSETNLGNNNPDDLFEDWQAFTGSSQSVKPHSNLIEKNSKVGELKHENLSEDWLNFSGSGESKGCTEFKSENNSTSDDWLNFTGTNDVKGPESKSLSDDWQDFTSSGRVATAVPHNTQDIDFGDFIQSSSSAAPTGDVNVDSLNEAHSDPRSFLSTPSSSMLYPSSNANGDSKTENVGDIQKYLSQMSDLSFMLKDELSVPDKLGSK